LADAAQAQNAAEENVTLTWSGPREPVIVSRGGDTPVTCMIMPQRVV
jgi:hypothetical protein